MRSPYLHARCAAAFGIAVLSACSSSSGSGAMPGGGGTTSASSTVVALSTPAAGSGVDPGPRITITGGNSAPLTMLFDTGSSGLRIFADKLTGATYTDTGTPITDTFGGTRKYYGTVGTIANVTFGGVTIAKPLSFQIITAVCTGSPPPSGTTPPASCAAGSATSNANIASEETDFGAGVFGVRPIASTGLFSPMSELPGSYGTGFIVSAYAQPPTLTVGITAQDTAGFQTYPVSAMQQSDGGYYWSNTLLPWCYAIAEPGQTPISSCPDAGVLTDSGGDDMHIYLDASPPPSTPAQTLTTLPAGTAITATLASPVNPATTNVSWTFTTGGCLDYNDPKFSFAGGAAIPTTVSSNNGLNPFLMNDVLFDLAGGRFGMRPVTSPPIPAFCS